MTENRVLALAPATNNAQIRPLQKPRRQDLYQAGETSSSEGKYWSTWNDSMSTGIMMSEGTCDDDGACTYTGSWNDPITGGQVTSRMTSHWTSPTTELFEMYAPGKDVAEMKMMEIEYRKQ
ncbi:MAG: DUF1579 domain-containing protein [Thermoanaerobaculia bacterium]|nr:DUF1579 domain-containing protein [Thermoanaerobaculia bacterium]